VGIYFLFKKPIYTKKTIMTITNVSTSSRYNSNLRTFETEYLIQGTVPECGTTELKLQNYNSTDGVPVIFRTINVYIREDGLCGDAHYYMEDNKIIGWVIIFISILVGGLAGLNLWLTKKNKMYAALQGASAGFRMFKGAF
jgi:hypothetical protein